MGYAKGIKWNDDLIKREILEVKNDLGISFLPSFVADDTLSEVLADQVKAVQPYWIICPHHLKDVPKVRVLMEHIKQIVEKL